MAAKCINQLTTENYSIWNGDSAEVLTSLPSESVHLSIYSPPFAVDSSTGGAGALFTYSSSERDLSNARSYQEFFQHYEFIVKEIYRLTPPGRLTGVHATDVPLDGANAGGGLADFPGDIIRLHRKIGFQYCARYHVWKEPLAVRNRTMAKGLAHATIVSDSSLCDVANADYLLMFRKKGENKIPIAHPQGLSRYAGSRKIPSELMRYKNWKGEQIKNKYSHWIWRQYASAFWDDIRLERVLPYKAARDKDDEAHMHPLQLDVIERCCVLWSNPGEVVLTPFAGVGSELYGALINGRKALGCELKTTYYSQMVKNLTEAKVEETEEQDIFAEVE